MVDDRREHPRVKITFPVIIHSPTGDQKIESVDISLGGAAIYYSRTNYSVDQTLKIEIILSPDHSVFCDARVVWMKPPTQDTTRYMVGLAFTGISEDDKHTLTTYIDRLASNISGQQKSI